MSRQIIAFKRGRKFKDGRVKPLSAVVAWLQKSEFSHCETVLSPAVPSFSARFPGLYVCAGSGTEGGVRTMTLALNDDEWEGWAIPTDVAAAHRWLELHDGEPYDWLGLLGFMIRRIKGSKRAWWCSEACADMAGLQDSWRFDVGTLRAVAMTIGARHYFDNKETAHGY